MSAPATSSRAAWRVWPSRSSPRGASSGSRARYPGGTSSRRPSPPRPWRSDSSVPARRRRSGPGGRQRARRIGWRSRRWPAGRRSWTTPTTRPPSRCGPRSRSWPRPRSAAAAACAVLGDMLELGPSEQALHEAIGAAAAEVARRPGGRRPPRSLDRRRGDAGPGWPGWTIAEDAEQALRRGRAGARPGGRRPAAGQGIARDRARSAGGGPPRPRPGRGGLSMLPLAARPAARLRRGRPAGTDLHPPPPATWLWQGDPGRGSGISPASRPARRPWAGCCIVLVVMFLAMAMRLEDVSTLIPDADPGRRSRSWARSTTT